MRRADSFEKTRSWERLKVGWEGDDRGWDGWMASPARWTWVWASSGSWWWTGKCGVLQSLGQRIGHDWVTELNLTQLSKIEWITDIHHTDSSHKYILKQKKLGMKSTSCIIPLKSSIMGKTNSWSWDSVITLGRAGSDWSTHEGVGHYSTLVWCSVSLPE